MGFPFRTRLSHTLTNGVMYPPSLCNFPFICEACTVRAHLQRELNPLIPSDCRLLFLERARVIDLAHGWAIRTLNNYTRHIRNHMKFRQQFQLPSLPTPTLQAPPVDDSIILNWHIQNYAATTSIQARDRTPSYNSSRALRSAYSAFTTWSTVICSPANTYKDAQKRLLSLPTVGPSDTVSNTMMHHGMAVRLGTKSTQSMAIHQRHIHANQKYRAEALLTQGLSPFVRYSLIAAQCVELIGWLAWTRSGETFTLSRGDITIIPPHLHRQYNLSAGVGVVLITLLAATKSSQTEQADIVIAYETSSGLKPGYWFTLLFEVLDSLELTTPDTYLFFKKDGKLWTSAHYRHNYLFPYLRLQRDAGDPYLQLIDDTPGNSFQDKFFSFHTYRIGAGNHCMRKREGCARAATKSEKRIHGRWRLKNTGKEEMTDHYQQPTVDELVWLTLLCF